MRWFCGTSCHRLFIETPCCLKQNFPFCSCQHRQMCVISLNKFISITGGAEDQSSVCPGFNEGCKFAFPFSLGKFDIAAYLIFAAVRHMVSAGGSFFYDKFGKEFCRDLCRPRREKFSLIIKIDNFQIAGNLTAHDTKCIVVITEPSVYF